MSEKIEDGVDVDDLTGGCDFRSDRDTDEALQRWWGAVREGFELRALLASGGSPKKRAARVLSPGSRSKDK